MRSLSPSSRLVLASVLIALIVLAVGQSLTPGTSGGASGSPPSSTDVAVASARSSESSPATPPASAPSAPTVAPTSGSTATLRPPSPPATTIPTLRPTPNGGCTPTDQDRYVYHPSRLAVQAACIRVAGTVAAIRTEADGDLHILLALDPASTHLLTPANQGVELGDLVIEPVCVRGVSQADAVATCAADPDPLAGPFPAVGTHVWMEGRYVLDLQHGGWAELHPLYRWGSP